LSFVLDNVDALGLTKSNCILDITLARGLNYYTGAIFEVEVLDVKMGSVGGGGRYDDLTGIFGMKNLSGVGISFGLDRIYLCLDELELFPTDEFSGTTVLFANYGEQEALASLKVLKKLRSNNVASEIYPSNAKMKKQFDYASKKGIPFLAMIGSDEMANNLIKLKNLESGEQEELNLESFLNRFA
jgi:histidyl-tRNA synthetase